VTYKQTDWQTDTGRQQRPRLRIASRGKKTETNMGFCWTGRTQNVQACWSFSPAWRRLLAGLSVDEQSRMLSGSSWASPDTLRNNQNHYVTIYCTHVVSCVSGAMKIMTTVHRAKNQRAHFRATFWVLWSFVFKLVVFTSVQKCLVVVHQTARAGLKWSTAVWLSRRRQKDRKWRPI